MSLFSTSKKGFEGEIYAADFLKSKGYKIVGKNFRSKFGEIDIIAKKDGYLNFCEVKTRWSTSHGYPEESINNDKLRKIKKTIYYYLKIHNINNQKIQIIFITQQINNLKIMKQTLIIYE